MTPEWIERVADLRQDIAYKQAEAADLRRCVDDGLMVLRGLQAECDHTNPDGTSALEGVGGTHYCLICGWDNFPPPYHGWADAGVGAGGEGETDG